MTNTITCPVCDGSKEYENNRCPDCHGRGFYFDPVYLDWFSKNRVCPGNIIVRHTARILIKQAGWRYCYVKRKWRHPRTRKRYNIDRAIKIYMEEQGHESV